MSSSNGLVTIGLPTYNRAAPLRRAVESALNQTHTQLELIISDNASTDGTEEYCLELCRRDPRVKYVRQPVNLGMTANYMDVLRRARGAFFMWLGDDDWLDAAYVSECLKVLRVQPGYVSVGGGGKYYRGEDTLIEHSDALEQEQPAARVLAYYQNVGRNSAFYGLMRRAELAEVTLQNTLGGDWLLVAEMAFKGKLKAIKHVFIHRSDEGSSGDLARLAQSFGLHRFYALNPFFTIAATIFNDIAWRSPTYRTIGRYARVTLARKAAGAVIATHGILHARIHFYQHRKRVADDAATLLKRMFRRDKLPHR